MTKTNLANKKTFAEEGLEDVMQEASAVEASLPSSPVNLDSDEDMQQVGGLEPIEAYYQLKPAINAKPGAAPVRVFDKGITLKGIFEKVWEREARTKDGRKFKSYTYIVRFADKKLYGFSAGGLRKGFEKLEPGPTSKVHVTYSGTNKGKDGTDYANFTVLGNKFKS